MVDRDFQARCEQTGEAALFLPQPGTGTPRSPVKAGLEYHVSGVTP